MGIAIVRDMIIIYIGILSVKLIHHINRTLGTMSKAQYNFEKNLLENSASDCIKKALGEWDAIGRETHKDEKLICICGNKNVIHFHYFFNTETGKMIVAGRNCATKFGLNLGYGSGRLNPILKDFLFDYRAIYTTLNNLVYTDEIRIKFIEFVKRRIGAISNLNEAFCLVKNLVDKFQSNNCSFAELEAICDELKIKVEQEEIKRIQEEEAKRLRQQQQEAERIEQAKAKRLKQQEKELKRLEREKEKKSLYYRMQPDYLKLREAERAERIKQRHAIAVEGLI